jgi:hypothetical protein
MAKLVVVAKTNPIRIPRCRKFQLLFMMFSAPGVTPAPLGDGRGRNGLTERAASWVFPGRRDVVSGVHPSFGPRSMWPTVEQQVSWLPDRSWADLPAGEPTAPGYGAGRVAVDLPLSSPVTVAGAAPVLHRLPCCLAQVTRVVAACAHCSSRELSQRLAHDGRRLPSCVPSRTHDVDAWRATFEVGMGGEKGWDMGRMCEEVPRP